VHRTKDQQIKHVVDGLALGVLANGVRAVTSSKMSLESGFNYAWRRWAHASEFPSIKGHNPGNLFWFGMGKSERRRGARVAWATERWAQPYLTLDGWDVEETLELHADEVEKEDWIELGRLFIERFKEDEIIWAETD